MYRSIVGRPVGHERSIGRHSRDAGCDLLRRIREWRRRPRPGHLQPGQHRGHDHVLGSDTGRILPCHHDQTADGFCLGHGAEHPINNRTRTFSISPITSRSRRTRSGLSYQCEPRKYVTYIDAPRFGSAQCIKSICAKGCSYSMKGMIPWTAKIGSASRRKYCYLGGGVDRRIARADGGPCLRSAVDRQLPGGQPTDELRPFRARIQYSWHQAVLHHGGVASLPLPRLGRSQAHRAL